MLRRQFCLRAITLSSAVASRPRLSNDWTRETLAEAGDEEMLPLLGADLGEPIPCMDSFGDIWSTTWADDDN
jgi:hypothetical protein